MEQTIWNFGVLEFSLDEKLTQYKMTKISYSLCLSCPDYIILTLSLSLLPLSPTLLHT